MHICQQKIHTLFDTRTLGISYNFPNDNFSRKSLTGEVLVTYVYFRVFGDICVFVNNVSDSSWAKWCPTGVFCWNGSETCYQHDVRCLYLSLVSWCCILLLHIWQSRTYLPLVLKSVVKSPPFHRGCPPVDAYIWNGISEVGSSHVSHRLLIRGRPM